MNLIEEHNRKYQFFRTITGEAMRVYDIGAGKPLASAVG